MKQIPRRFAILAGLILTVNIIGLIWIHNGLTRLPKATVRMTSLHLSPDKYKADRLTLLFDRDLVSKESVGGIEHAGLFTLEPDWPGNWQWSALNRLEYMLDKPLPPGRVFWTRATDEFQARTGKVIEGDNNFRFQTVSLALKRWIVIAADNHDVTLEIMFNQPVDPEDLLRHVKFYDDKSSGELGGAICLTKKPEEKLVVRVRRPHSNKMRIALDERLTGHEAELSLGRKIARTLAIASGFSLLNTRTDTPNLDEIISVRLQFSHRLNKEQKIPKITVEPSVEKLKVLRSYRTLRVNGKFEPGKSYKIKVPGTLLADSNSTLGTDKSVTIKIPDRRPALRFVHEKGFLSPLGNLTLDIKAANVEAINFKSWRVHQNNLVPHLHGNSAGITSRFLLEKTVKVNTPHNKVEKLAVNLQELIPGGKGIYRIKASATNRKWYSAPALVTITDLAITAKTERNGSLVWVTSLRTGKPVAGVRLMALTHNNQTLATAKTDASGIARLKFTTSGPDGGLWVITAEKDDDLSYLRPADNRWVINDVEQSGRAYAKNYEVMLYTERGVYRPGDTIYLTGIIREETGKIPPTFPLAVKVIRPDGRQIDEIITEHKENSQGIFHIKFPTRNDGQTGSYRFRVTLPGSKQILGSTHVFVEAFVPLRMEVKSEPTAERFGPNEPPTVNVSGRYLWDQPAAKLPVKVQGSLRKIAFNSKKYPDFHFSTGKKSKHISVPTCTGQLDNQGKTNLEIQPPKSLEAGIYRMALSATVTETGGRSVSSNMSAILDNLDHHIGLRLPTGRMVEANEPVSVDWVSLTGDEKPNGPGEMEVRLVEVEYDTVLKEVNRRRVWQSVEKINEIKTRQISMTADSKGSFQITCPDAGKYRIIVTDKKTKSGTKLDFYACEHAAGPQSLAMNQPERLEVVTEKKTYLPGETAKVLVRSPLPGTLLLTVETDHVVDLVIAEVQENTVELEVPLSKELRGGAFITATVVRAIDPAQKSWLPHRAMGMARILLDHNSHTIPVKINAPKKVKPGQTVSVTIENGLPSDPNHPTFVHIWAVDEGILLTSAYQTPHPMGFFFSPRRLGVSTADIFFRLLPDYDRPAGITRIGAGDRGPGTVGALRRNPVPTRQRKPAVVWRKAAAVNADGKVTIEMKLPDLIGQMRLMAVAVDHDRYGRAEHALILTAPLIVETSWPRFVAPEDTFQVPVKLFNSTERTLTVRLGTKVDGPINIAADSAVDRIVVEPKEPATYQFNVEASKTGSVIAQVEAVEIENADESLTALNKAYLSVRPATALHSEVKLEAITAGDRLIVEPSKSFVKGTARMKISISPRPEVQLQAALERLVGYPYGCVEQTSSRLFALLYAGDILGSERAEEINSMVQAGIARLWAMQTRSGGLGYWPGAPRFTKELAKYLESQLLVNNDGTSNLKTKVLFCRVLSTFGQPPHGWMNRLAEQKDELDAVALAHLAGAFHAAGNKERALALLPEQLMDMTIKTTTAGRLTSQVQQEAVLLSVMLDIDPNNPMVAPL
ncbi:MAG: alpha-2-macroglobulin family protein, partial [Planctomycetota bacterium]